MATRDHGRIGVALFGLGRMGLMYLKSLMVETRVTLYWVVRRDVRAAEEVLTQYRLDGTTQALSPANMEKVFSDERVNAVIVASSTESHEEVITRALTSGKAVFCEKPITGQVNTTEALYEMANNVKQPLFCAFQRRFDASFRSAWDKVRCGEIGKIHMIKSSSRDCQYPPVSYLATSGGVFFDSTIHDMDQVCWFMQAQPVSVYVCSHSHNPDIAAIKDIDTHAAIIKFDNGGIAIIDHGRSAKFAYDQRLEVVGANGIIQVGNQATTNVNTYLGDQPPSSGWLQKDSVERYIPAYNAEISHFLDVMEGKSEMSVTKESTLQAMRLVTACQESVATGLPVTLSQ